MVPMGLFAQKTLPNSTLTDMTLAELIATRFSHDITGPIGAVNNGIELLQEADEEMQESALNLMESSIKEAIARLSFYRLAYGTSNQNSMLGVTQLKDITSRYLEQMPFTILWQEESVHELPHLEGRLMLNLIIIACGTLIRGGTLDVSIKNDGITLNAAGKTVVFDEESQAVLNGDTEINALTPRTVQLYMTHLLAEGLGYVIRCNLSESQCTLTAHRKP